MNTPEVLYFGCYGTAGHYTYHERLHTLCGDIPRWLSKHDGELCPVNTTEQGKALLHHWDGFSTLSFWDRSGDSRGGSNSIFWIGEVDINFEEAVALCRAVYPAIFARFKFEITNAAERMKAASDLNTKGTAE